MGKGPSPAARLDAIGPLLARFAWKVEASAFRSADRKPTSFCNKRGADRLLSSQFTLGGEGEVAAGPVGRNATAQTDAKFTAEIISWSRTRGVFAGVSLQGATLRQDGDVNKVLYGKKINNRQIVDSAITP